MKVEIKRWKNEPFGIELTAETPEERTIIKRFNEGGIKINAIINVDQRIQLTFKDLIIEKKKVARASQ